MATFMPCTGLAASLAASCWDRGFLAAFQTCQTTLAQSTMLAVLLTAGQENATSAAVLCPHMPSHSALVVQQRATPRPSCLQLQGTRKPGNSNQVHPALVAGSLQPRMCRRSQRRCLWGRTELCQRMLMVAVAA